MYEILEIKKRNPLDVSKRSILVVLVVIGLSVLLGKSLLTRDEFNLPGEKSVELISKNTPDKSLKPTIFVDVAGAVMSPGMYELAETARMRDLLKLAGGLSLSSDPDYITKKLNLAQKLSDGSKIYIPFLSESSVLNMIKSNNESISEPNSSSVLRVNDMTYDELVSLNGIGDAYANRILLNKPYDSYEELIEKTKIPPTVLNSIKDKFEF